VGKRNPVQVILFGVKAYGVIVYLTTASAVEEALISESVILPVPFALLPVADPEVTDEDQEKLLPGIVATGVKFSEIFEQMVCVEFVPVLFG
jgi:hypothetical protein